MNNFLGDKVECELYLDFINYSVLLPVCLSCVSELHCKYQGAYTFLFLQSLAAAME